MDLFQWVTVALLIVVILQLVYLMSKRPGGIRRGEGRVILVDTSALIDGRIVEVAKSGFLSGKIIVPRSVVNELQLLADKADHDKRAKARHGLDVIQSLQQMSTLDVAVLQDGKAKDGVDSQLVRLAKAHQAHLLTLDYNLIKVAEVEGISILNINELAQTLRLAYLPGEQSKLTLNQKGQDASQAVGYLADGTMVVVEQAGNLMGKEVEIEFTRALQTQAGKMMFAKLVNKPKSGGNKKPKPPTQQRRSEPTRKPKPQRRPPSPEERMIELAKGKQD